MAHDSPDSRIFASYAVGLHNVGSYMVSCTPWITGSTALVKNTEHKIEFPKVTKSVTVVNHTAQANDRIYIHFNSIAAVVGRVISDLHYVELDSDEDSFTFNVKCKEIYLSAPNDGAGDRSYRVYAELTQIQPSSMFDLTGSGLTD